MVADKGHNAHSIRNRRMWGMKSKGKSLKNMVAKKAYNTHSISNRRM